MKEYFLQGLDCPNCAAKIEAAVFALEGVVSARLVFASAALRVQLADGYQGEITPVIEDAVRLHEPDVIVLEKTRDPAAARPKMSSLKFGEHGREFAGLLAGAAALLLAVLLPEVLQIHAQTLEYITLGVFIAAYIILGADILWNAAKNIVRKQILDENFLMASATLGAFALNQPAEAVSVMLFYKIGEFFQDIAVDRSRRSITALMDLRPDYANLKKGGDLVRVAPDTLRAGDVIIAKPGEKIPLDGIVLEGESMLDTSALTGESIPRRARAGDAVLSGCLNQSGVLTIEVQKTFGESTVAKIISLMENAAGKKAKTENFITKFAKIYTPVVVISAVLLAVLPLLFGGDWREWLHRSLVFLVISCPCALVLSIPLSFFSGIGRASKSGILVKGGNYLEACTHLDTVVFDKTGTLTKGVFKLTALHPASGVTEQELLALAAAAEAFSNHPIALSVMQAYRTGLNRDDLSEYTEYAGNGVSVIRGGKVILAGNQALMEKNKIAYQKCDDIGTLVYVAHDGQSAGCLVIADEIKPDSRVAVMALKKKGVRKTVMLSGDRPQIAAAIAQVLGLDEAYGGLLPHEKAAKLRELDAAKAQPAAKIAFVGDGINDAPVLAAADVGIAMGGLGSDAALEAADVVLMTDEPSKIGELINISRRTMRIVRQNIVFALGVKAAFLALGALGMAAMWEAVFADVGVTLLVVLNAMRRGGYNG